VHKHQMSLLGSRLMDWRSKLPGFGKKQPEPTLTPAQVADLAHVCLDVQSRSLDAFLASQSRGRQVRRELFRSWSVSYQLTAQPNGVEHRLAVSHEGSVPPELRDAILRDALPLLAYCVRLARLSPTAPVEVEASGLAVRRVLLVDQTRKLKRSPDQCPSGNALSALFTAASSEAASMELPLDAARGSPPSPLMPQNR